MHLLLTDKDTVAENALFRVSFNYLAPGGVRSTAISVLCVCGFVCPLTYLKKHTSKLYDIYVPVTRDHDSVLF